MLNYSWWDLILDTIVEVLSVFTRLRYSIMTNCARNKEPSCNCRVKVSVDYPRGSKVRQNRRGRVCHPYVKLVYDRGGS